MKAGDEGIADGLDRPPPPRPHR